MIVGDYRDFMAAIAASAGSLTGLLFVALSVAPRPDPQVGPAIIQQIRASAALRSILSSRATASLRRRQTGLITLLLLIFGSELVNGIAALAHPHETGPVEYISYALVASVLVGVARAWELVSDRDTGILASLVVLTRHEHAASPPPPADPPASGSPGPG